jgi:hypothetical protein
VEESAVEEFVVKEMLEGMAEEFVVERGMAEE